MKTIEKSFPCHVCQKEDVKIFEKMREIPRAASDCRPWKPGGTLGVCHNCGVVQKVVDDEWRAEAQEIYAGYDLYHQSINGIEQSAFNATSGEGKPRSKKILEHINNELSLLPLKGRMIDVGCGTGGFLSAFSSTFEGWELNGLEPNVKARSRLMAIPNVNNIYSTDVEELPGTFDLISVIHALEHIENPIPFLKSLKNKLNENGILLIQVPYFRDNPFDLIIADHCTHFTIASLSSIIQASGFEIAHISSHIIDKEITLLAKKSPQTLPLQSITENQFLGIMEAVSYCLQWLETVILEVRTMASSSKNFGLFGTSISANWLLGLFESNVAFFVDEDENRVGHPYYNKPVYHPKDVPLNSSVFMPLPQKIATLILNRNKTDLVNFTLPPNYTWPVQGIL